MRSALYFLPCALLTAAIAFSCGGTNPESGFKNGGGNGPADATTDDGGPSLGDDGPTIGTGDGGNSKPQCQGLECQWVDCGSMGKPETVLSGTVYDPAGNLPLYNVYVYVPNATPLPINAGDPTCTACEAPASGNPIIGALTDPQGHFSIQYQPGGQYNFGVPAGQNIPLVIQVGKWRKQLKIPTVTACQTNNLDAVLNAGTGKQRQLRLPGNGSEGDMPLIAFTSGCDPAECFLRHVGIDDSEFAPPGTAGKHVHFYTGWDPGPGIPASSVAGGNTPQQTYQWWQSASNLLKYDIVFDACECQPNDRGANAYTAMQQYLDNGGRLFTTHYYYNWFTQPGVAEYNGVAAWAAGSANGYSTYWIDTSFPKGQAYGAWLLANGIATGSMQSGISIAVQDTRNDVNQAGMPAYPDSTRWIYNADSPGSMGGPPAAYSTAYVSFNTPVSPKPAPDGGPGLQCGRAVFSDVHLSGLSDNSTFPNECANADPGGKHVVNEKALEFLFFDLSSCVQNDEKPPPPPPPQ